MLDLKLLLQRKFLMETCSEPVVACACPHCGCEYVETEPGLVGCPACLTFVESKLICSRCKKGLAVSGGRKCASVLDYVEIWRTGRPAFAGSERLWQVCSSNGDALDIFKESMMRRKIAAAQLPYGTKVLAEYDEVIRPIEDFAEFTEDLRNAPTPEAAKRSGADYFPDCGDWNPTTGGSPFFVQDLEAEVNALLTQTSLNKVAFELPTDIEVESVSVCIPPDIDQRQRRLIQLVQSEKTLLAACPSVVHASKVGSVLVEVLIKFCNFIKCSIVVGINSGWRDIFWFSGRNRAARKTLRVLESQVEPWKMVMRDLRRKAAEMEAAMRLAESKMLERREKIVRGMNRLKSILQEIISDAQQFDMDYIVSCRNGQLQARTINDKHFSNINERLKAVLARYGVLTALDIEMVKLQNIPEFGRARIQTLFNWRKECNRAIQRQSHPSFPEAVFWQDQAPRRDHCIQLAILIKKNCLSYHIGRDNNNQKIAAAHLSWVEVLQSVWSRKKL